jgi:hypothetical protein
MSHTNMLKSIYNDLHSYLNQGSKKIDRNERNGSTSYKAPNLRIEGYSKRGVE